MSDLVKVILKSGKDQSVMRYHPWVFSGAIKKIKGDPREGDIVAVFNNKDEQLGIGHYQASSIAVRIFSFEDIQPDREFWKNKFVNAYNYRLKRGIIDNLTTNVYRLIYAEGDGLPGLIIDFYNGTAVFQAHSIGMYKLRDEFVSILKEIYGDKLKAVYNKSANSLPKSFSETATNEYIFGDNSHNQVIENGNQFLIDWEKGQKTGFFVDQRDNRQLLKEFAKDKKVLNMFGYTGGFSVYALSGEAAKVVTVDSSAKAIDLTNENVLLNGYSDRHEGICQDAFDYLENMDNDFDIIILDPPAFAKHHNVLKNALQGYKKLNAVAFRKIKPGGFIFTFSCSQVVNKDNFRKSVFVAAANSGRKVRLVKQLGHPSDHPINLYHPEGEYLKGLVLQVE